MQRGWGETTRLSDHIRVVDGPAHLLDVRRDGVLIIFIDVVCAGGGGALLVGGGDRVIRVGDEVVHRWLMKSQLGASGRMGRRWADLDTGGLGRLERP